VAEEYDAKAWRGVVGVKADGNGKGVVAIVSTVFGVREIGMGDRSSGDGGLCRGNDDGCGCERVCALRFVLRYMVVGRAEVQVSCTLLELI
jgi:hypothetical protein